MQRKLSILQELSELVTEKTSVAPLPSKAEALYVDPMAKKEGRNCKNCVMWSRTDQCLIHHPNLHISADEVCGYHSPGEPMDALPDRKREYVSPKLSGLILVKGGTYCGICHWSDKGQCHAVIENNKPAPIEEYGCCARWTARS